MRFAAPQFFWALAVIPCMIVLFIYLAWQRKRALQKFGRPALVNKLLPKEAFNLRPFKNGLLILGYTLLIFALARPQFGTTTDMIERKGIDIMVALDISRSMLAEDIVPNRIQRAKHEISKLIDLLTGDRIGLIVFAGESFVQSPLTLDYGASKLFLEAVTTEWIATQGTDVAGAIDLAQKSFPQRSTAGKVLLIISDGEAQQGDTKKAAIEAAQNGIVIYTVGVGNEKGEPIPLHKGAGNVQYLKDAKGNAVMTRLDPKTLEETAIAGGGAYFSAGVNLDLPEIYAQIQKLEQSSFGMAKEVRYSEQYQLFLALALLIFIVEFGIPDFILQQNIWRGRFA